MTGELFNMMAGTKIVHVPYKGGSEAVVATASGQVEIGYLALPSALPLLDAGRLKVLAVTTKQRWPLKPSIPTLDESGLPGYELFGWQGIVAPANTPKEIITRLHGAIAKAVGNPEMKDALNKQGREPFLNTPEQFAAFIQVELDKYAKIVKAAGVQPE
jgi:tripartite-type tricarboxylate transporter receptor subunit TctC